MYRIVRRCSGSSGPLGKYLVEFSIELPSDVKRAYLLSDINSWAPGSIPLVRVGRRGYARIELWGGTYRYAFYLGPKKVVPDPENIERVKVRADALGEEIEASVAKVGIGEGKGVAHDHNDPSFLECLGDLGCVLRFRVAGRCEKSAVSYLCSDDVLEGYSEAYAIVSSGGVTYLESVVPCVPSEYELSVGGAKYRYYLGDEARRLIRGRSWFWGSAVLEVSVDDAMDRYDDVLTVLKYLGIDVVRLRVGTQSFLRPEDMLDLGEGASREVASIVGDLASDGKSVLLDVPLTYVTPCFKGFLDVIVKGRNSRFSDWFVVLDEGLWRGVGFSGPSLATRGSCYVVYELMKELQAHNVIELEMADPPMLRLNLESLGVVKTVERTIRYWLRVGCRGLVISRSYTAPKEFLDAVAKVAKEFRSDAVVLGESLTNPTYQLLSTSLDGVVDYGLGVMVAGVADLKYLPEEVFKEVLTRYASLPLSKVLSTYPSLPEEPLCGVMSEEGIRAAYALLLALPGPLPIRFADVTACGRRFRAFVKALIKATQDSKALREGTVRVRVEGPVVAISRSLGSEEVITVVNVSRSKERLTAPYLAGTYKELITGGIVRLGSKVKLGPGEVLVLKRLRRGDEEALMHISM